MDISKGFLKVWLTVRTILYKSKRKKQLGIPYLTWPDVEKLMKFNINSCFFKKLFPEYEFLHGVIVGLQHGDKAGYVSTEQDFSSYHILIRDKREKQEPLKDLLTGKTTRSVVVRFNSHDPVEIENFIRIWLDKDFKFD